MTKRYVSKRHTVTTVETAPQPKVSKSKTKGMFEIIGETSDLVLVDAIVPRQLALQFKALFELQAD